MDDFEKMLSEMAKNAKPLTFPHVYDNKAGHCLEVSFSNANYYGGPSHNGVTLLRCQETDEIVGCIIHRAKLI